MLALELHGQRRLRALPGGTRGLLPGSLGPTSIDLYGTRLAYTWELIGPDCRGDIGQEQFKDDDTTTELWLGSVTGRQQRIAVSCSLDPTVFFHSPSFAAGRLSYVAGLQPVQVAAAPRVLRTLSLSTGTTTQSPAPSCLSAMVRSSDAVYVSRKVTCPFAERGSPAVYQVARIDP